MKLDLSDKKNTLLNSFYIVSFVIWICLFSIIRYAIIIEILSAIIIVKFFTNIQSSNAFFRVLKESFILFLLVMLLWGSLVYSDSWGHVEIKKQYVELEKINIPQNALIKLYDVPTCMPAALAINNKKNSLFGYGSWGFLRGFGLMEKGKMKELRDYRESRHKGSVIIIGSNYNINSESLKERFRKDGMYCRQLHFNLWDNFICVPEELKYQILLEENKYGEKK